MSAEARNVAEELFKLVDKDESGRISEAEYAAACGPIAKVSQELLPADFAKLDSCGGDLPNGTESWHQQYGRWSDAMNKTGRQCVAEPGPTTTTGGTSTCTILELQSVFATPDVWNYL